jgi:hypothetical protein
LPYATYMPKPKRSLPSHAVTAGKPSGRRSVRVEAAKFLNIDLDVRSRRSLAPLITAWPWVYQPMLADARLKSRWLLLNARGVAATADAVATLLLQHIENLRGDARRCWKGAHRRVFDIGVQAGGPGRAFEEVRLTGGTLGRIAAVGAQIQLTVYPAEPETEFVIPGQRRGTKAEVVSRSKRSKMNSNEPD